jgi:2-phosphosulfolactate phosphatase
LSDGFTAIAQFLTTPSGVVSCGTSAHASVVEAAPMQIEVVDFVAGARAARGIAVVIDVFRAFSVAAYAFSRGASAIIPVADIELARAYKAERPQSLLIGERFARALPGFDCGNSPSDLLKFDLAGRTLIHTTHSGTQGLTNAMQADEVLTGALVNAAAIVRYLQKRQPEVVTLVRMGQEARERCVEDDICAELIGERLRGRDLDKTVLMNRLHAAPSAQKFFDPACDWAPEQDFELCTQFDRFDFVLRLDLSLPIPTLQRRDVGPQAGS